MELKTILTLSAIAAAVVTTTLAVEARYALDADVEQVAMRLDAKIKADKCYELQRRLWALQDRYGPTCGDRKSTCRAIVADMKRMGC